MGQLRARSFQAASRCQGIAQELPEAIGDGLVAVLGGVLVDHRGAGWMRRHIRYVDDRQAIISDDFFDEWIVRGTELAEPDNTTRENILKEAGYEQVYDIDQIITRMPTPEEIERLAITPGTRVAEHIRTGYTRTRPGRAGNDLDRPR